MLKKTMPELNRIAAEVYIHSHNEDWVLVLDNVRSAHNVGSIFRTADSFGVGKIFLCGITCSTDNRELQKTALGAEISIPSQHIKDTTEIIEKLKLENYKILGLEQTKNSSLLTALAFDNSQKYALVLGNEVEGISEDVLNLCDKCIEIPQIGSKHSLNVTNAASILMWEIFKSKQQ